MPRTHQPPKYRLHKARGCAVVTSAGKNHHLGPYGSPESHEKYARLIAAWNRSGRRAGPPADPRPGPQPPLLVNALILRYFTRCQAYYVKDGHPTSEVDNIRQALRFLRRVHGHTPAADFGPRALLEVRQAMIDAGRCRALINKDVHRVRAAFRWAAAEELLPAEVPARLAQLAGLRKGRSAAREAAPVLPADEAHVRAALPHLPAPVAAMAELQLLCGCRPQEAALLRPGDVDRSGDVWLYRPPAHKTEHLGRARVIALGPRAQAVLAPWLDRDPAASCFCPAEAAAGRGRAPGGPAPAGARRPGPRYTRHSYRVAMARACRRAGVPVWRPLQLRHTRATQVRAAYGLEAAQVVLSHAQSQITEIYAERDLGLAARVMRQIG